MPGGRETGDLLQRFSKLVQALARPDPQPEPIGVNTPVQWSSVALLQ